jgi:hypothetical protein
MAKADEKGVGRFHHCVECCSLLHWARFCLACSPVDDGLRNRTQVSDNRVNQDLRIDLDVQSSATDKTRFFPATSMISIKRTKSRQRVVAEA